MNSLAFTSRELKGYNFENLIGKSVNEYGFLHNDFRGSGSDFKHEYYPIEVECKFSHAVIYPSWIKRDWLSRFSNDIRFKVVVSNRGMKLSNECFKLLKVNKIIHVYFDQLKETIELLIALCSSEGVTSYRTKEGGKCRCYSVRNVKDCNFSFFNGVDLADDYGKFKLGSNENDELPVMDIVKVQSYKTIYKNDNWWMCVAIVKIKGFYKVKIYQCYKKDGKWKVMKDVSFNEVREIETIIEALKESVPKLMYYIENKPRKRVEINKIDSYGGIIKKIFVKLSEITEKQLQEQNKIFEDKWIKLIATTSYMDSKVEKIYALIENKLVDLISNLSITLNKINDSQHKTVEALNNLVNEQLKTNGLLNDIKGLMVKEVKIREESAVASKKLRKKIEQKLGE